MQSLRERSLPGFFFLLLLLAVYADPLFFRRNFGARDLLAYNLPVEKAVHDAYARGRLPVWLAQVSGGRPLLPNINVGALYPVRPLLSLIPFPLAMRIYPVLHWALAGFGLMLLIRATGLSVAAAWVGAVTYVFSGVGVCEIYYTNHLPGFTLLPWIVWSVARRSRSAAETILLSSFLLGLDFLAGDVFTTSLALLAAAVWILLERDRVNRLSALVCLGASLALAGLLALPQLVATYLWIPQTDRAISGLRLGEALRFSVSPWRLLEFLVPYPFGPTWLAETKLTWARPVFGGHSIGFFTTLYTGSFAALAAVIAWRRGRPGQAFARALGLISLALCILPSLAPAGWSGRSAPLPLRYPEKMALGVALAAAVFASAAWDQLRAEGLERRWPIVVGVALALAAVGAAAAPRTMSLLATELVGAASFHAPAAAVHLPGALAEGGLLWMVSVVVLDRLRSPGRLSLVIALTLVTIAPIAANRRIAQSFPESELFARSGFARAVDRRDPQHSYRVLGESPYIPPSRFESAQLSSDPTLLDYPRRNWFFFTPVLWNRGLVFNEDFDRGDLSRLASLRRLSVRPDGFSHNDIFFASVSLKFGIRFPDQPPPFGYRRFGGTGLEAWDENPQALPDLRLLEKWREEPAVVSALQDLGNLSPGEVVVETGRVLHGSARPGRLRILEKSPERLRVETEAPDPTFLFVLRDYWSYRSVRVDRNPVDVFPAQLAFSAVSIPAGRHRVDWVEKVPGGELSVWGPVSYFLIALVLFWTRHRV